MEDRQHEALILARHCTGQLRAAGIVVPDIEVRFDLRGVSAGRAVCRRGEVSVIRLNPIMMAENDRFVAETVPHEVAHIGVFYWLGRHARRPHGREWRRVMRLLGAEPSHCHCYSATRLPVAWRASAMLVAVASTN